MGEFAGTGAGAGTFAEGLRHRRWAVGLTQEELAERAGLSARGISDLERGARTAPRRDTLLMLADGLGLAGTDRADFLAAARRPARGIGPTHGTSDPFPGAPLPVYLDAVVDREGEVGTVGALVADAGVRLLTLTGPGGVGKTRLAVRAAAGLRPVFPGGVAFVPLATIGETDLVPGAVAAALGLRDAAGRATPDLLATALRGRRVLLVLDNLEQVVGCGPFVAALLGACPALSVLATSREPLRVAGEHRFPVPPLQLPDPSATAATSVGTESVRLFVERARAADARFALDPASTVAVSAIVRRLDGLPLAIELAAARVTVLPPEAMRARLDRALPLLSAGPRGAPERQRTLRGAIGWSHDLLSPPERIIFRRLAVFVGGFTVDAAEDVARADGIPDPGLEPLDGVASLLDKGLLQKRDAAAGGGVDARFAMLETVREFALERLLESGEEAVVRERHAEVVVAMVAVAADGMEDARQGAWLRRLDAEDGNLRAAFEWALAAGRAETAQRLGWRLWRYWDVRGRFAEGRRWLEQALALDGGTGDAARWTRAAAANALGKLVTDLGDYREAAARYEESLAHFRRVGPRGDDHAADALGSLGLLAAWQGDYDRAERLQTESLAIRRRGGDPNTVSLSLTNLGDAALARGDIDRARALHTEALALRERTGNGSRIAASRYNLGEVARYSGDAAMAAVWLASSLERFAALGNRLGVAYAEWSLAHLAADAGAVEEAAERFATALAIREDAGDPRATAECFEGLGALGVGVGVVSQGFAALLAAASLRQSVGAPIPPVDRPRVAAALAAAHDALGVAADAVAQEANARSFRDAVSDAFVLASLLSEGRRGRAR